MDYSFKYYKDQKIKSLMQEKKIIFFCNSFKTKQNEIVKLNQTLKSMNIHQEKIFNKSAKNVFSSSCFKNFSFFICGIFFLLSAVSFSYSILPKSFERQYSILNIKLNNKIYIKEQFKNIVHFSYLKKNFGFWKTIKKSIKYNDRQKCL